MEMHLSKDSWLSWADLKLEESKAALLGVPWDSSSTAYPGQRFAVKSIREELNLFNAYDFDLKKNVFNSFTDLGNLEVLQGNRKETQERLDSTIEKLFERNPKIIPVFLGGDHSIAYQAVHAMNKAGKKFDYSVFDAHLDLWQEYGNELHHGNFNRFLFEENLVEKRMQLGTRTFEENRKSNLKKFKVKSFHLQEIRKKGFQKAKKEIQKEINKMNKIYLSIDIDVLSPEHCPGTGHPEPEGFSVNELNELIKLFKGKIIAADICEVNPLIDSGRITSVNAAYLLKTILSML